MPLVDPSRRGGLTREHPFTKALFDAALTRLRPLVEEERRRAEAEKAPRIESHATRRRLDALERAAAKFLRDSGDDDLSTGPDRSDPHSSFTRRGFLLSPPFAQLIKGQGREFTLSVDQRAHPGVCAGATVEISVLTPELAIPDRFVPLESCSEREAVLAASFKVRALEATKATGLRAEVDDSRFRVVGETILHPEPAIGVARCRLSVAAGASEAHAKLIATVGSQRAEASIHAVSPLGSKLEIRIEDIDLVNQRYRWRQNVLEIAARHPSLSRYLGSREARFPGQETRHFRLLLAEIVAEAVCAKLLERQEQANPEAFEGTNWGAYYDVFSSLMTAFLPTAHGLVLPTDSL